MLGDRTPKRKGARSDLRKGGEAVCGGFDLDGVRGEGCGVGVRGERSEGREVFSKGGDLWHWGYRPMNMYSDTERRWAVACVPKV